MVVYTGTKLIFLSAVFAIGASSGSDDALARLPRQAQGKGSQQDQSSAETGFLGGGGVENSKYFHYQHLPEHDKYEFGHRRGNEHHVIERYEKAVPHDGQFKTKVRWADKKGGHGEHYWDYNHAGHEGKGQGDGDGGYSDPIPVYTNHHHQSPKQHQKRQSQKKPVLEDVKPSHLTQPLASFKSEVQDTEGDASDAEERYDIQRETIKQKRAPYPGTQATGSTFLEKKGQNIEDSHLIFDLKSGKVIDEITGKKYLLQPVN